MKSSTNKGSMWKRKLLTISVFLLALVADVMVGAFYTLVHKLSNYKAAGTTSSSSKRLGKARGIASRKKLCSTVSVGESNEGPAPQVVVTGFSNLVELQAALEDAFRSAMEKIPSTVSQIDFAMVAVSSLYDGSSSATPLTAVVPILLQKAMQSYNAEILNLIGCTSAGLISTVSSSDDTSSSTTVETEGSLGVSVTLCILPDVEVTTFHVENDSVLDDVTNLTQEECFHSLFGTKLTKTSKNYSDDSSTAVFVLPSPAFLNHLDDFLRTLNCAVPAGLQTFGAVASTVSSLSRARLFQYSKNLGRSSIKQQLTEDDIHTYGRGCVGVMFSGDIQVDVLIAQGAKPVGGIYRIGAGEGSMIRTIILEDILTDCTGTDAESINVRNYAARSGIPKPPLAEANFLLKHILTDDEASFMKRTLLIGVAQSNSSTADDLERLSSGEGYSYEVYQVANAGLKDGSVTLPLDCVNLKVGQRVRFFVREGDFSKRELNSLWAGYIEAANSESVSGCFIFPSLDRGTKIFGGKPGYESGVVSTHFLPNVSSISGFFSNGVIGPMNASSLHQNLSSSAIAGEEHQLTTKLHSSATCFAMLKSRSSRPVFNPAQAKETNEGATTSRTVDNISTKGDLWLNRVRLTDEARAPRSSDGELILRRREIHSGRSLTVSTVEWSVAEKRAVPTSALEGWMWEKETEVDRFRERVPLANLLSQVKLSIDSSYAVKPRDWIGMTFSHSNESTFTIIPELKRSEPRKGALRARYSPSRLVDEFSGVASTLSVNSDGVMFGGSLDDISTVRTATELPVLVSDLILYPYQLYQMRLKGADAVVFIAAALSSKDLTYLTKIASSLGLQSIVSVSSEVQLKRVNSVLVGDIVALIVSNRNWEDLSIDESGHQALQLLRSDAMELFRLKFPRVPILVEGRIGLIEHRGSATEYIKALKESGASGAIVGSALAATGRNKIYEINNLIL